MPIVELHLFDLLKNKLLGIPKNAGNNDEYIILLDTA